MSRHGWRAALGEALAACVPGADGRTTRTPAEPPAQGGTLVELVGVGKRYPGEAHDALASVDLTISRGGFLSVTGDSGAGKTTLLNILGCIDRPTRGSYRLAGRAVAELGEDELAALRVAWLGFVFQHYHLIEHLTVRQNLEVRFLYGAPPPADLGEAVGTTLASLGLADLAGKHPRHLSGGEKQRVAIARTIVRRPLLLLADEPAGNLDERNTAIVFDILERVAAAGTAVVVATHDRALAARAHRRLRLHAGQVVDVA